MKALKIIEEAYWVEYQYKTGFKPVVEFKGYKDLLEKLSHKKGPKPKGFMFYSKEGVVLISYEENYSNLLNNHAKED